MARAKSQILSKEDLKTAKAEAKAALKEAQAAAKVVIGARKTLDKGYNAAVKLADKEVVAAEKAVAGAEGARDKVRLAARTTEADMAHRSADSARMATGDAQARNRELRDSFTVRRNEEFASVLERANAVVLDIAKQDGYDLIVQEAVYINPKYDLTDRIIKALDR